MINLNDHFTAGVAPPADDRVLELLAAGSHAEVAERRRRLAHAVAGFDAATIAFGLRNLADPILGLREMVRVARRRAVVLEFVRPPRGVVGATYRLYLKALLPAVGGLLSGAPAAYRYLSDTVDSYRTPEELTAMAVHAGWSGVSFHSLAMGTVGILSGRR